MSTPPSLIASADDYVNFARPPHLPATFNDVVVMRREHAAAIAELWRTHAADKEAVRASRDFAVRIILGRLSTLTLCVCLFGVVDVAAFVAALLLPLRLCDGTTNCT